MTTTRVTYGAPVTLTDPDGTTTPVKGILNGLNPSKYFGYLLQPFDNSMGWEDIEICAALQGVGTTDERAQVNVYLYTSCDGNRFEPYGRTRNQLAALSAEERLIKLTGNETLLGYVYLVGAKRVEKHFNLSAVQRFTRGFPPRDGGIIIANCSENDLGPANNSVTFRGMRREEIA